MKYENGKLLLFRLFGVNVFVHWSWLLIAILQIGLRQNANGPLERHGIGFDIALYLCLFLIVLIHEFGHALACKSVGGRAERIVLWPLGGLAFVNPPQRPGAVLWSIAAGPLVNVILLPLTIVPTVLVGMFGQQGWGYDFLYMLSVTNIVLLVFNMLPIYPLDGGQILRSLIWFVAGRGLSLVIAACIGLVGGVGLGILAAITGLWFTLAIAIFMGFQSVNALKGGLAIMRMEKTPRRLEARCPRCGQNPPVGGFWMCPCRTRFDMFATAAQCPHCRRQFPTTACPMCGSQSALEEWYSGEAVAGAVHAAAGFPVQSSETSDPLNPPPDAA